MRTLISNLNVIRATRVCGCLCNGFNGISTRTAVLAERFVDIAWRAYAALHEEPHLAEKSQMFWKPLDASTGRPGTGSEKHSSFLQVMDQTCPTPSRLWGHPPMTWLAVVPVSTTSISANRTSNGFDPAG